MIVLELEKLSVGPNVVQRVFLEFGQHDAQQVCSDSLWSEFYRVYKGQFLRGEKGQNGWGLKQGKGSKSVSG